MKNYRKASYFRIIGGLIVILLFNGQGCPRGPSEPALFGMIYPMPGQIDFGSMRIGNCVDTLITFKNATAGALIIKGVQYTQGVFQTSSSGTGVVPFTDTTYVCFPDSVFKFYAFFCPSVTGVARDTLRLVIGDTIFYNWYFLQGKGGN
jgi:hypothetical protein